MQLAITEPRGRGFIEVELKHGKESINFSCKAFAKVRPSNPKGVFHEINGFLETLEPTVKKEIFERYKKIKELYEMDFAPSHVAPSINSEMIEVFNLIDLNKARRWLCTIGNIHIPADVEDTINEHSRYNKPNQTYVRNDYINLATLSMLFRLLIPVFGQYIDQTSDQELYKETEVISLIDNTKLMNWPYGEYDHNGEVVPGVIDKVTEYVRFCTSDKGSTLGNIWSGLATAEIPTHLTAKVMVRRLTILALNDHTGHSIVANIFRYVKSNAEPIERTSADAVKDKHGRGSIDENDDKKSFIEEYKTKQRIAPGDVVAFNLDALNHRLMANKVDPDVEMRKVITCVDCVEDVLMSDIAPHQVTIAQWVMAKAFPTRAFYHIDKRSVNNLLATTQGLLWHWGFPDIAIFLQVKAFYNPSYSGANLFMQPKIGTRITGKHRQALDEKFPHMRLGRMSARGVRTPSENMSVIALNNLSNSLRSSNWIYMGPKELLAETEQIQTDEVLIVPVNIKYRIAELLVHLADINQ